MNPDDIARILDELGQRLSDPASRVFELTVRQVVIEATWSVGMAITLVVLGVIFSRATWRWLQRDTEAGKFPADMTWSFLAFSTTIGMIIVGVGVLAMDGSIVRLLNPEFAALQRIITTLQGVTP